MTYFEQNLNALLKNNSGIRKDFISGIQPNPDITVEDTVSGMPTALYRDKYIHSRHNPYKEAQNVIASQVPAKVSLCIFYGIGLGYLPEAFNAKYPEVPCLIIEPDISMFVKALWARDMTKIAASPRISYFVGTEPEQVAMVLENHSLSHVHIVKLRAMFEKDKEYYQHMDHTIEYFLKKREINKNTLQRFGKLWIRNLCANIRKIAEAPGIKHLAGKFSGFPALIIAAGPSLTPLLPLLKDLTDKMLVIAVDTSLHVCQENGIDPDFVIVADPQYWNTRHLDYARPGNYILISESSTHPRVFRRIQAPVYMGSSLFPLGRYLEGVVGEKGKLGAGGSVATSAWDFARIIGAEPIVMAGLDLGFPGMQTHYRGSYFESRFFTMSSRFIPIEHMSFAYLYHAGTAMVPANNNGTVLSDQRMLVYRYWFETQHQLYPHLDCKNLSESGTKINGIPFCDFHELLQLDTIRPQLKAEMDRLKSMTAGPVNINIRKLKTALNDLISELRVLKNLAQKGVEYSLKFKNCLTNNEDLTDCITRLNNVDQKLLSAASKTVIGFLLQPLINEITDTQFTGNNREMVIEYSRKIYTEIGYSCDYHLQILGKTVSAL